MEQHLPSAMVLAEPAACRQRSTMSSQYASVGTSARPTHANESTTMHPINIGRLPHRSDKVPQNIGATAMQKMGVQKMVMSTCGLD